MLYKEAVFCRRRTSLSRVQSNELSRSDNPRLSAVSKLTDVNSKCIFPPLHPLQVAHNMIYMLHSQKAISNACSWLASAHGRPFIVQGDTRRLAPGGPIHHCCPSQLSSLNNPHTVLAAAWFSSFTPSHPKFLKGFFPIL